MIKKVLISLALLCLVSCASPYKTDVEVPAKTNHEALSILGDSDSFTIAREESVISFREWVSTISKLENVRFEGNPTIGINPKSGQVISSGGNPSSSEILVNVDNNDAKQNGEWVKFGKYSQGKIVIELPLTIKKMDAKVTHTVLEIAKSLNAKISYVAQSQ